MKRIIPSLLLLLCLFSSCTPSPRKVKEAIGRGEVAHAVDLLVTILNEGEISDQHLDTLLKQLADSHHQFKVNNKGALPVADNLMLRMKTQVNRRRLLPWYVDQYLLHAEGAMQYPPQGFKVARTIWRHYQKQRKKYFPAIQDSTPVLGVIDLREAEYLVRKRKYTKANQLYHQAKKQLTVKQPFDLLKGHDFKDLALTVEQELKRGKK